MEYLISCGHQLSEIRKYSLKQYLSFLSLAWGRKENEMGALASAVRLAYHADNNVFSEYLNKE